VSLAPCSFSFCNGRVANAELGFGSLAARAPLGHAGQGASVPAITRLQSRPPRNPPLNWEAPGAIVARLLVPLREIAKQRQRQKRE
jgi:hypothetical protein